MSVAERFAAQKNMILGQVLPQRVTNAKLLAVLARVPRKMFVPEAYEGVACIDGPVPLGYNRYMIAPQVFSTLVNQALITPEDSVLDVGCNTGYSTAVISFLARKVVGLESNTDLASKANTRLNKLQIDNGIIMTGTLSNGHGDGGPYDVIFVGGMIDRKPEALFEQLAIGGRLICVFEHEPYHSTITTFTRTEKAVVQSDGEYASAPQLSELCMHHHVFL